jgi:uncharacterized protein
MKTKNIFIILLLMTLVAVGFYSLQPAGTDEVYRQQIEKERKEKDDFMRNNSESPFADSTALFTGLAYFTVDERYRLSANLVPIENKKTVTLATSDGLEKRYLEYAYTEFSVEGKDCKLLILEIMDMGPFRGTLFLAFADATSATETYGAGRYLDIKKVPGSTSITLDFNKAYNPYCAYTDKFSCPFPPRENMLEVAIKAGEKNYQ